MGMAFIMLAHGFQGTLLGVRAVKENFGLSSTGFLFSGYLAKLAFKIWSAVPTLEISGGECRQIIEVVWMINE